MTIWYIDSDDGNDTTGNGTSGNPYKTIAKAQTVDATGDTFYLYNATAHYTYSDSGLNSTYQGQSATGVIMDMVTGAPATTFTANKTTAFSTMGIYCNATYWSVRDLSGVTATWDNCIFTGSLAVGTPLFAGRNSTNCSYLVKNSKFYNMTITNGSFFGRVSADPISQTYTAYNNTFYFDGLTTGRIFPTVGAAGETFVLKNNIFYNALVATAITMSAPSNATMTYQNNCAYQMTTPPSGTNNITNDPLFIDIAANNFNLRPTSPCRDTGILI